MIEELVEIAKEDKRVNIDQMRVIYNSMKYPITYVQGPPGTGKTQTILNVVHPMNDVIIPHDESNLDGLNYLEGKKLSYVNQMAFQGTLKAHECEGGVPCNIITIDNIDEYTLGYMFYFFMRACAMSAYLLKINPFNQPGVEVYKKNMFHLLGKKGY